MILRKAVFLCRLILLPKKKLSGKLTKQMDPLRSKKSLQQLLKLLLQIQNKLLLSRSLTFLRPKA